MPTNRSNEVPGMAQGLCGEEYEVLAGRLEREGRGIRVEKDVMAALLSHHRGHHHRWTWSRGKRSLAS